MAYADDLLEQARHLANRERKNPRQASLRRAVSTAYYALFHLLIHEATLNWRRVDQRPLLADSLSMEKCGLHRESRPTISTLSSRLIRRRDPNSTPQSDNATTWTRTEVITLIELVDSAFKSWNAIREDPAA